MKKRLKINGFIIFLTFLLLVFFPTVFLRNGPITPLEEGTQVFGITLIMLGQILRASARGYKSENSGNGHSLIQNGPYILVRNPMYLGIFLIGLGIVLALFNWWVVVIFLCIFIWRYLFLIFKEEKKLLAMFPGIYQNYQQRVPRLLPAPAIMLQKDIAEYLPLKPLWLKKEIGSILAVLLIVLFLEGWKDIKSQGIKVYPKVATLSLTVIILFIFLIIYLIKRTKGLQKNASDKGQNTL